MCKFSSELQKSFDSGVVIRSKDSSEFAIGTSENCEKMIYRHRKIYPKINEKTRKQSYGIGHMLSHYIPQNHPRLFLLV